MAAPESCDAFRSRMKMETAIVAWRDGIVATVHRPLGATFDRKAPLVTLEPQPTS